MENKEIFAKNLARFMKKKQLSRKDLSSKIGVPYSTISEWLNANKYPRIDKIEKLAILFNCSKANLIEEKETVKYTNIDEIVEDLQDIMDGLDDAYRGATNSDNNKATLRDALFMTIQIAKRHSEEYRSNQ